ncbi:YbfB/YjiJ family MFS transporter, partial [Xylella fastidiosa subsp. multiplex]|nr:YbfB/YjiJ family MFS transporter [Xylella fastidiosa subsp. multiplex]
GASLLSFIFLLLLFVLTRHVENKRREASASFPVQQNPFLWWQLAALCGCAGVGYIIIATYLPLVEKTFNVPFIDEHL